MMRHRARPLRFTLAWIGAAVLLLPLSLMIWTAIGSIVAIPALLAAEFGLPEVLRTALAFLFLGFFAAAIGACIGALQWFVTRRYLRFDLRHWREVSAMGAILAGAFSSFACSRICVFSDINQLWVRPSARPAEGLLFSILLFLGILSVVQFLTLRQQAVAAALWVVAHLVSVPMVYALWQYPLAQHFPGWSLTLA